MWKCSELEKCPCTNSFCLTFFPHLSGFCFSQFLQVGTILVILGHISGFMYLMGTMHTAVCDMSPNFC